MVAAINEAYPDAKITMVPGGRGDFLVVADGVALWDKRATGEFPAHEAILAKLA